MSFEYDLTDLLLGTPVKINNRVSIKVPKVKEVVKDNNFENYTGVFTIMTRQAFASAREVDEIEAKYPNIWSMMWDEPMDAIMGKMFGQEDKNLSDIVVESLAYWTGLDAEKYDDNGENIGFVILRQQQKIIHIETEWLIDITEFNAISNLIKTIISWNKPEDMIPPKPMTDAKYQSWMGFYEGMKNSSKTRGVMTWADKMLLLSVSTETYIPLETIGEMTIFTFYQTFNFLNKKDAYDISWKVFSLPDIDRTKVDKPKKHWKESARIRTIN